MTLVSAEGWDFDLAGVRRALPSTSPRAGFVRLFLTLILTLILMVDLAPGKAPCARFRDQNLTAEAAVSPWLSGTVWLLAVAEAVADGVAGGGHVHHGGEALQAVMAGLVEDIAEARNAGGFAREVSHQAGGAAAEDARDGVQFLTAAALQVVAGHYKIAGTGEHGPGEQQSVFAIPETAVAGRFRQRL